MIHAGDVRVSEHGYDELAEDGLTAREAFSSVLDAIAVDDYILYFPKEPCALLLHKDSTGKPAHVVWGIPNGYDKPAVLVTAYRPDPTRWDETVTRMR